MSNLYGATANLISVDGIDVGYDGFTEKDAELLGELQSSIRMYHKHETLNASVDDPLRLPSLKLLAAHAKEASALRAAEHVQFNDRIAGKKPTFYAGCWEDSRQAMEDLIKAFNSIETDD